MLNMVRITVMISALLVSFTGFAHQTSHSQINFQVEGNTISGQWHVGVDDLERSAGLDVNGDADLTWGELLQKQTLIGSLAKTHLRIFQNQSMCNLVAESIMLDNLSSGIYVYLPIKITCPQAIKEITIDYDFLFSFDAQHKAILSIQSNAETQSTVFNYDNRHFVFDSVKASQFQTFLDFIWQGMWHIWIGIDHILFLLSLLLPTALILRGGRWQEKQNLNQTLINTTKIITAFTVAHSITLALSVFDLISLSSRIVESIIAASVIVAALNNIRPVVHRRLWLLTFFFGLIHGMGFASVLNDVGLTPGLELLTLSAFNIGVEIGQLVIVAIVLPLIYVLSLRVIYRNIILQFSSFVIAAIAFVWFIERVAEIDIVSWV